MNKHQKIAAIITARMGSSRLPRKVLLPLADKPVIAHLADRILASGAFDPIILATSTGEENRPLVDWAQSYGISVYRGAENDVLDRYINILRQFDIKHFARFCADNPLTDMQTAQTLADAHLTYGLDYCCISKLHLPLGLVETFSRHALEIEFAETDSNDTMRRESIGIFIREQASRFRTMALKAYPPLHQSNYRLTLDYEEDYKLLQTIFQNLYQGQPIPYEDVITWLSVHPDIARSNQHIEQKTGNNYWQQLDKNIPSGFPPAIP